MKRLKLLVVLLGLQATLASAETCDEWKNYIISRNEIADKSLEDFNTKKRDIYRYLCNTSDIGKECDQIFALLERDNKQVDFELRLKRVHSPQYDHFKFELMENGEFAGAIFEDEVMTAWKLRHMSLLARSNAFYARLEMRKQSCE